MTGADDDTDPRLPESFLDSADVPLMPGAEGPRAALIQRLLLMCGEEIEVTGRWDAEAERCFRRVEQVVLGREPTGICKPEDVEPLTEHASRNVRALARSEESGRVLPAQDHMQARDTASPGRGGRSTS